MTDAAEIWGDFWSAADVHGCTRQFPEETQRSIAAHWRKAFADLPDRATVLDLATGRGAVLAHARDLKADERGFVLLGVDRAPGDVQAPGLTIMGSIDADRLPFADRSFTLVTSQFGVEYGTFEVALSEAARVCASALLLLVHASDGIVVAHARQQADQAAWMLHNIKVMDRLRTHFSAPTPATAAVVDEGLRAIGERAESDENIGLLEQVWRSAIEMQHLAETNPSASMVAFVDHASAQLSGHSARMSALLAAAVSSEQVNTAVDALASVGFTASWAEERSSSGALAGRWIQASRS